AAPACGPVPAPARPAAAARRTALLDTVRLRPPVVRAATVPAPARVAAGRAATRTPRSPRRADAETERSLVADNPRHDAAAANRRRVRLRRAANRRGRATASS